MTANGKPHYAHEKFFIPTDDGYTERGYIAEVPGLHPALSFTFRPLLTEERDAIGAMVRGKPQGEVNMVFSRAIQKQLKTWSAKNADGKDAPIDAKLIRRLHPAMFDKLYLIIDGSAPSGFDPGDADETKAGEDLASAVDALLEGTSPGQKKEEGAAKN